MIDILFRGFTPDDGGRQEIVVNGKKIRGFWVEGNYWKLKKTTYCFREDYDAHPDNTMHYIVFDQMTDWGLPNRHMQADVIPETVGRFTGLGDKNHKQVFENDIVRLVQLDMSLTAVVRFGLHSPNGQKEEETCVGFYLDFGESSWLRRDIGYWFSHATVEVVGNIHENPSLLPKKSKM